MADTTAEPRFDLEPMSIDPLLAGFDAACDRFHAVIHSQDSKVMYQPLFEALNWIVALDDRLQVEWTKAGEPLPEPWSQWFHRGENILGIRFARNRIHHQWANAIGAVSSGRDLLPPGEFEWRWFPSNLLPTGRSDTYKEEYDGYLAGERVRFTLRDVQTCVRQAVEYLAEHGHELLRRRS